MDGAAAKPPLRVSGLQAVRKAPASRRDMRTLRFSGEDGVANLPHIFGGLAFVVALVHYCKLIDQLHVDAHVVEPKPQQAQPLVRFVLVHIQGARSSLTHDFGRYSLLP